MCDQKYQKPHKVVPALCILPASSRFASYKQPSPSGANIASEPSRYSLAAATGSKRSSADSDSLLCHVRLWQTSRLSFWQKYGREHSEIKFALHNTHVTPNPPLSRSPLLPLEKANSYFRQRRYQTHARLTTSRRRRHTCFAYVSIPFSGRAGNACTNLLGYFV